MDLNTSLLNVPGIGFSYAKRLEKLNLFTVEDLINHYPFRYDDFSKVSKISEAKIGETTTFMGEVWSIKNIYTRVGKILTKGLLNDGTGSIEMVWFNQSYLTKSIKTGDRLQVSGKVDKYNYKISLVSPQWEKITTPLPTTNYQLPTIHTGRLVPVYPETYGVSSKWLRAKIAKVLPLTLNKITDPLPTSIKDGMIDLDQALSQIHFPKSMEEALQAKYRLSFDELFYIQLATQKKRAEWTNKQTVKPFKIDRKSLEEFIGKLPFKLTEAQEKVTEEIICDLKKSSPMNKLLQGEVGSGKTVVAAICAFLAHQNGLKTVVMAPTEILAFQHFDTFKKLLEPYEISVGIYTGSKKFTNKNSVIARSPSIPLRTTKQSRNEIASLTAVARNDSTNQPNIIIGTHALLSEKLVFDRVGLVVIDEQQRFGVAQRSLLRHQAKSPHFLTMTATPIPRTVALTLYGDLDLSIIDQMPVGRKIVKTYFVPGARRKDCYKFIGKEVDLSHQIYIITPLIEESETQLSAKAAKKEFERLQKDVFPKFRIGLLHGRLKSKEKESVINSFKNHELDILVSTSVVEVGVDIPNATVMVVEGAERFGLAQLHQLRGRVGRGEAQSFTFLFTEQEDEATVRRIKNLEKIYDGLKLAEIDLKIRGSGEIFGTTQSGRWALKIANLSNLELVEKTREAAAKILCENPSLDKYPVIAAKLSEPVNIMPD